MVSFKQKCSRCRTNFVLATSRSRYLVCSECHKKEMVGEITDPEMIALFDIPEELYDTSMFLRNIKINYLKYGSLSEKQIEAFKKAAKEVKEKLEEQKKENPDFTPSENQGLL